jgi:carbon-monoxide dehydrogenase large subunit
MTVSNVAGEDAVAGAGHRVRRKQGDLMLTGRGGYLDDVELPGMLHAAIVRSTEPHARIVSIDTDAARALPGVRHVMTGAEAVEHVGIVDHFFDPAAIGARTTHFRCLAVEEVIHAGEAVAAVVADTLAEAEAARDAIVVEYEPLRPSSTPSRRSSPERRWSSRSGAPTSSPTSPSPRAIPTPSSPPHPT